MQALKSVLDRIDSAARASGRDPTEVHLVAVSKTHGTERIAELLAAGQQDFGESYAQELRDKARLLQAPRWHFVGRLQTNKAKYVAPVAFRVHALENLAQAEALATRAPNPLPALLAVNVGREPQKGGVDPEAVVARLGELARVASVPVVGLMCIPPETEDPEDAGPYFAELAERFLVARKAGFPLAELSMGMSHDFEVAIRYGATWVRVGTALFGPREG